MYRKRFLIMVKFNQVDRLEECNYCGSMGLNVNNIGSSQNTGDVKY